MISQEEWDRLDDEARMSRLRGLVRQLPLGFEIVELRDCALGEVARRVGVLRRGEDELVLVPSGTHDVGFDVERGWRPDAKEKRSWKASAEDFGLGVSLEEHLARVLRRRRRIATPAMLVETKAREVGYRRVDPTDPSVADLVAEHAGRQGVTTVHAGDRQVRLRSGADGVVSVEIADERTHADLLAELAHDGFRVPTPDEWELLCAGGATTLYRWGDHAPTDRYPTDVSPEEAAWRQRWVHSGGKLAYPAEGFAWGFDLHRRPNALGLTIAFDPYRCELTTDPRVRRGGDGGTSICGGMGYFLGWLPLASAYDEPELLDVDPEAPIDAGYTYLRRCLEL